MKKLNFNMLKSFVSKILVISIMFTYLPINSVKVFADETGLTNAELNEMKNAIQAWLNDPPNDDEDAGKGKKNEYTENGTTQVTYIIFMPKGTGDIVYDSITGLYLYNFKDDNGIVTKQVPFNVDVIMSTSKEANLPTSYYSADGYQKYLITDSSAPVLETSGGELIKIVDADENNDKGKQIAFVVELANGKVVCSSTKELDFGQPWYEAFWDWITSLGSVIVDWAYGKIIKIFNDVLLDIADGIQSLIDNLFNSTERITLYKVIFGKVDKLSINYWARERDESEESELSEVEEESESPIAIVENAPVATLKSVVEYWYGVLRGIAIAVYIVLLLYIGIRILLASTTSAAQKYKQMLSSWLVGIIILLFYPYVMRYTVIINDVFVQIIDEDISASNDQSRDAMLAIRRQAEEEVSLVLTAIYIVMLGQLVALLVVYYKRVFMMAFLITIFPIVAAMYVWEKVKGGSKALSTWTREYAILVLTQTFHAVIYAVLINGAYQAFMNTGNWLIFIISVLFLFQAEKIIRSIFGMKSTANTIGELAATGAAVWGASTALKGVFKRDKQNNNTQDRDDADAQIEDAYINNAAGNAAMMATGTGGAASGASYGGSGGSSSGAYAMGPSIGPSGNPVGSQYDNLSAARAMASRDGYDRRSRRGVASRVIGFGMRAAGATLGLASGLATGDLKEGFANAAIGNEFGGVVSSVPKAITGWTMGAFSGRRMRRRVMSGAMDDNLRDIGFDLEGSFDQDAHISSVKAEIIREALAAQAEAARRGGRQAGEVAFMREIERGRRRHGI